jgi:hypothetical protein
MRTYLVDEFIQQFVSRLVIRLGIALVLPRHCVAYEQLTIIGIGEPSKVDEEAANTSLTPIPRQSWKSKKEIAVCLMVALLIFLGGALFFELSRRAHYAYPSKQGPRVSESM